MTHKEKVKLARRMRTLEEKKNGTPLFLSQAWEKHKEKIKKEVALREKKAQEVALKRSVV